MGEGDMDKVNAMQRPDIAAIKTQVAAPQRSAYSLDDWIDAVARCTDYIEALEAGHQPQGTWEA